MKRSIFIFALLIVSASAFGFITLLDESDFGMQQDDNQDGPALSSASNIDFQWESYNQWQCFSRDQITLDCAEYDESSMVPSIRAESASGIFFFDLHVEDGLLCENTLAEWRNLVNSGNETCIFAAHMPSVEMGVDENSNKQISLWYIDQIKGKGGYWALRNFPAVNDEEQALEDSEEMTD